MNLLAPIQSALRSWLLPEGKAVTTMQPWMDATITDQDRLSAKFGSLQPSDARQLVARLTSVFFTCVIINATNAAQTKLRLYRPASANRKDRAKYRGRRVTDRRKNCWLRNPVIGKAASYADDAGDVEEVLDHPILDLLRHPQPGFPGVDFATLTNMFLEATGRCMWNVVQPKTAKFPTALCIMAPQYTRIVPGTDRLVDAFVYGQDPTNAVTFDADDVVYLRHLPSPHQMWGALSWAHAVSQESDLISAAVASELNRWQTGAQPDFLLSPETDWSDSQMAQVQASIRKAVTGVRRFQNYLIARAKVTPLAMSTKDMNYIEGQAVAERRIRNAAGIPESMADLNAANLASATTSNAQYQRYTLLPRVSRFCEQLNDDFLPYFISERGELWLAPDNPVTDDLDSEATRHGTYLDKGTLTINEVRADLGYAHVDGEDGDVHRINGVPLSMAGQPVAGPTMPAGETGEEDGDEAAKPTATPQAAPTADVQATALNGAQVAALQELVRAAAAGEIPLQTVKPSLLMSFPNAPTDRIDEIVAALDGFEPTKPDPAPGPPLSGAGEKPEGDDGDDPDESGPPPNPSGKAVVPASPEPVSLRAAQHDPDCPCCKGFAAPRGKAEPSPEDFENALTHFFGSWEPDVVDRLASEVGVTLSPPARSILAGDKEAYDELIAVMDKWTSPTMLAGNATAVSRMRADGRAGEMEPWDVLPEDAIAYLRGHNGEVAQDVLKNYDDAVRSAVSNELADVLGQPGLTPEKLRAAVARAVPGISEHRAGMIAETETNRAYNAGQRATFDASPYVVGYRWETAGNPCPVCQSLEGRIVNKTASFLPLGASLTAGDTTITNDYADVKAPPLHVGCKCILNPVYDDEKEPTP